MNTVRLYEFLVLSKVLNYSSAAKALYLSQPVLTKHIKELEKELDAPLFVRTTHGVALTETGRILAKEAPALIDQCDSAFRHLRSKHLPTQGKVRIGIALEFSYSTHIRQFCQQFAARYPGIELIYDVYPTKTPPETVRQYDLFFTPCIFHDVPPSSRRLLVRHHGTLVILPPSHPLMSKSLIHLQQLAGQTIIVPFGDELFGPYAQNYLLTEIATKRQVSCIKVDNLPTALFLVSMGKGVCIAPAYAKNLLSPNTFVLSVSNPDCRFDEYLYYNESDNGAAELFFREFREAEKKET